MVRCPAGERDLISNFSPPASRLALGVHPSPYLKVIGSTLHQDIVAALGGRGGGMKLITRFRLL